MWKFIHFDIVFKIIYKTSNLHVVAYYILKTIEDYK